jgi:hypothetical protein
MVRSRSRNSLSDPQQLRQSVLSEPPRDRSDVDAIEQWQIWIDSAVRTHIPHPQLAHTQLGWEGRVDRSARIE